MQVGAMIGLWQSLTTFAHVLPRASVDHTTLCSYLAPMRVDTVNSGDGLRT